jgi:hypothetical protein
MRARLVPSFVSSMLTLLLPALGCDGPPPCAAGLYPGPIDVPETNVVVTNAFRVSAEVATPAISLSIVNDAGTLTVGGDGPLPAFIYARTPQPDIASTVFSGLAVEDGAWYPFWFYCGLGGGLVSLAWEKTTEPVIHTEFAAGPCSDDTTQYMDTSLQWPAHRLANVALACGFSAFDAKAPAPASTRPWLVLNSAAPGSYFSYANDPLDWSTILPFATADCRRGGCGASGSWYEIHAVVWHATPEMAPAADNVAFTIFYFPVDGSSPGVYEDNGFLLPAGAPSVRQDFPDATWQLSP